MHRSRSFGNRLPAVVAALLVFSPGAPAQTPRSGGGGGDGARLQQMLVQANAEKTALAGENQKLKDSVKSLEGELAKLRAERDGLAGRASRAEGQVQRAESGRTSVNTTLEATQARLQEVVGKYRELAEATRTLEGERNTARAELARAGRELDACRVANVELAGIAEEALVRYEEKGVFTALAQKEPFTGIQRARIGNLVDGYRGEIEARKLKPAAP